MANILNLSYIYHQESIMHRHKFLLVFSTIVGILIKYLSDTSIDANIFIYNYMKLSPNYNDGKCFLNTLPLLILSNRSKTATKAILYRY